MKIPESETERTMATRTVTGELLGASVGRALAALGGAAVAATAGATATAVGAGRAAGAQASPSHASSTDTPSQRDVCTTPPPSIDRPLGDNPPRSATTGGAGRRHDSLPAALHLSGGRYHQRTVVAGL